LYANKSYQLDVDSPRDSILTPPIQNPGNTLDKINAIRFNKLAYLYFGLGSCI